MFYFIFLLFIIIWIIYTNTHFSVKKYTIYNPKLPNTFENYKIVEISDLHNYNWKNKLPKTLHKLQPDIIVICGDLIDARRTKDIKTVILLIKQIIKIAPIYYVNGNHEATSTLYSDLELSLKKVGVTILNNKTIHIYKNQTAIALSGIIDPRFTSNKIGKIPYLQQTLQSLAKQEHLFHILLVHRPEHFLLYSQYSFDLIFSGHAHGGQVRIPFIGGLIAPGQGFFPKYSEKIHKHNNSTMIISRGMGHSRFPLRINNMMELVVVTLKK